MSKNRDMILGALVGDAASLGLHWIYDQPRIRAVGGAKPEFCITTRQDYDGIPSYFAHPSKAPGDLTQYGEQLMVMLHALATSEGRYNQTHYEQAFLTHFGDGGSYQGYIDHATRETLENLMARKTGDSACPGADDTQLPAVAKLPALIAAGQERNAVAAIRTTNNTDIAEVYGQVATAMLVAARDGHNARQAVNAGLAVADNSIRAPLEAACAATDQSTEDFTADIGMACELSFGLPSVVHTLLTAPTYTDAIRRNIRAGGDSCGRAILLGGVLGAVHGPPQDWVDRLVSLKDIQQRMETLEI
ncbi:ADP-ribosylglycohydrolase family protein (plasmid) [Aliisedimentitalea scapharcae]|uniref:ADP-ribosylglycohydrolase family protein n=1 Tax=Aliisedimentitalea scapharcae TaxID=1524259 RepID=A0ABZ2XYV5_9RHOB